MKGSINFSVKWDELSSAIGRGDYNSNLPYGESSEPAPERNVKRLAFRADQNRLARKFETDLRELAVEALNRDINYDQWRIIYDKAYEEGHSSGYTEVIYYLQTYLEIVWSFLPEIITSSSHKETTGIKNEY